MHDEQALRWWREIFMCCLTPDSYEFREGQMLLGARLTLVARDGPVKRSSRRAPKQSALAEAVHLYAWLLAEARYRAWEWRARFLAGGH